MKVCGKSGTVSELRGSNKVYVAFEGGSNWTFNLHALVKEGAAAPAPALAAGGAAEQLAPSPVEIKLAYWAEGGAVSACLKKYALEDVGATAVTPPPGYAGAVTLAPDYASHGDARSGPLRPGQTGTVTDSSDRSARIGVRTGRGREWYYDRRALITADAGLAAAAGGNGRAVSERTVSVTVQYDRSVRPRAADGNDWLAQLQRGSEIEVQVLCERILPEGAAAGGGGSFDTAAVGQLVEHGAREATLYGFRCPDRGLVGDTSGGCSNADRACRLRYSDNGQLLNVMSDALRFIPSVPAALEAGSRVVINGLVGSTEYNGRTGVVASALDARGSHRVRLDSALGAQTGEIAAFYPANLMLRTASGGGGRPVGRRPSDTKTHWVQGVVAELLQTDGCQPVLQISVAADIPIPDGDSTTMWKPIIATGPADVAAAMGKDAIPLAPTDDPNTGTLLLDPLPLTAQIEMAREAAAAHPATLQGRLLCLLTNSRQGQAGKWGEVLGYDHATGRHMITVADPDVVQLIDLKGEEQRFVLAGPAGRVAPRSAAAPIGAHLQECLTCCGFFSESAFALKFCYAHYKVFLCFLLGVQAASVLASAGRAQRVDMECIWNA